MVNKVNAYVFWNWEYFNPIKSLFVLILESSLKMAVLYFVTK